MVGEVLIVTSQQDSSSFVNTMSHSHSETPPLAAEFESRLMQCILGLIVLIPASFSSVFHGWKPNSRKTKGGNQGEMKATKGKCKQRIDKKTAGKRSGLAG